MNGTLYTFGYQELKGAEDLRAILPPDVKTVVDVRLSPWSGNRAFSTGTRSTVEEADRRYVHLRGLGNLGYKRGTIEIANIDAIEVVLEYLRSGSIALMCVCPKPDECHRLILCEEAVRRMPDLRVVHLSRTGRPTPHQRLVEADQLDLLPVP